MNKKILIIKGSPRPTGNCATFADQVRLGAQEVGAEVDDFLLNEMDIHPCNACNTCLENGGVCKIKDDMQILYPKIQQADAMVIASPVYWFTVNAQVKSFIDRWYAFEPIRHQVWPGKEVGLIVTYNAAPYVAIHTLESIIHYLGMNLIQVIQGTARKPGKITANAELMKKAYQLGKQLGQQI